MNGGSRQRRRSRGAAAAAIARLDGRASQAQLAGELGISSETVGHHCRALEGRGQIERGGLDKARSNRGSLIDRGRRRGTGPVMIHAALHLITALLYCDDVEEELGSVHRLDSELARLQAEDAECREGPHRLARAHKDRACDTMPMQLRPRAEWGAADPTGPMRENAIERVTIHHTATTMSTSAPEQLRAIQAFHQGPERGWPDIAYHVFVDADGNRWEGRSMRFEGDSATRYDLAGHVHVAVLGNFEETPPAAAQVQGLWSAIAQLLIAFNLPQKAVASHRDYAETACPGGALYPLIWPQS